MNLILPRFIVLKSNDKNDYLGYIHEDGESDGVSQLQGTQAVSPIRKFEVEIVGKDGLVHISRCQNNKYWVRTKNLSIRGNPLEQYFWITATANKEEEDQSEESCTLFKFICVDPVKTTVRIKHVQSGCYLCLWQISNPAFPRCVMANYTLCDSNSCDIFTIIDWEPLLILPRYVAFKGHNDSYLCLRQIEGHPYTQFATDDIGDSTVACEIFVTDDRNVRINPTSSNKFWRATRLGFGRIPMTLAATPRTPSVPSVTKEAQLTVEEPVLTRNIYNVKYDLDNSRIYDETDLPVAKNYSNYTQESTTLDVKLSYTDTRTSVEWGETKTSTTVLEVVHKVVVPPMTKVTVHLIATNVKCDVPFTYMQRDTLYNGTTVTNELPGNNDNYLCLRQIEDHPYLQFATDDIGDSTVACEIFVVDDGNVRIKSISSNKFWKRNPNWIWAESDDTSSNNKDNSLRPVKVDNKTIGLLNLGNKNFCKPSHSKERRTALMQPSPILLNRPT
ncbi:uncharacterized protein LOC111277576 [Durio zibethinus]|uniref:Uncharacterized protein LOC111277576 n=1 Tax=Durio zibethinus TaxID=66656 RepID=A0A6P5WV83_DURZI|nr:uncharacterized protein LOC111277576 [Durio zibethinus]